MLLSRHMMTSKHMTLNNSAHHSNKRRCQAISTKATKDASSIGAINRERIEKFVGHENHFQSLEFYLGIEFGSH